MTQPTRPLLRWHGGKWLQADAIMRFFPPHRVYVEPFGGAASVLLKKERAYAEVYNDLDQEVVNLFRVLQRDEDAQKLVRKLQLTPFAREEFNLAYLPAADPIERARCLVIRSFMGFGSDGATGAYRTGFRANSNRSGTTPARDWMNYPDALATIVERLRGVIIENRDALEVMAKHDSPATLHFVDPPYLLETRSHTNRHPGGGTYRHELDGQQHLELLAALTVMAGMVVLCGYPSEAYDAALPGWRKIERAALADGARPRTEVLWINPAAMAALGDGPLFGAVA